jgi:hypothetical protein
LPFREAIADVAAKPDNAKRHTAALAWAARMASVRNGPPLRHLLGVDTDLRADVSVFCQTTKARNILRNYELRDAAELLNRTVGDLWDLRPHGVMAVLDILQALLVAAASSPHRDPQQGIPSSDGGIQRELDPRGGWQPQEDRWPGGQVIADIAEKPSALQRAAAKVWAAQIEATEDCTPLRGLLGVPGSPHADVSAYCETTRAYNILHRSGLTDLDVLLGWSVSDLRALRECGMKTVLDILQAILVAAASQQAEATTTSEPPAAFQAGHAVVGAAGHDAASPEPTLTAHDIPYLIDQWASELGHREALIARHRLPRDRTLDDLGNDLGITRERVRQIERKVRDNLADWRASDAPSAALLDLNNEIRKAVIAVTGEQRLLAQLPELAAAIPALGCQIVDLIPALLPGITRQSGWIAVEPLADLRDETMAVALATGDSPASANTVSRLEVTRQRLGLTEAEWPQWLGYCGLRAVGGTVVRASAGITEVAAALLRQSGHPMSAEDIAVKLGAESIRSVKNSLWSDRRIVRLAPNLFGLLEWGLESYEGIREEIIQRIDRGGGRVEVQKLVDELVTQFGVSPKSVQSYASGREFVRKAGWLYLAGDQPTVAGRSSRRLDIPAATRRCYFRDGRWWFRVDVGTDALRGSGFAAPTGVMRLFQVAEGTERMFCAENTRVRISWVRPQPAFGSVRPLLLELQAEPGDTLWLTPADGDRIDVRLARVQDASILYAIAHLSGAEPAEDADLLRKRVAEAAGLPTDKNWDALAQALRGRGDADIAELIEQLFPAASGAVPTFDEFLSALRGRR